LGQGHVKVKWSASSQSPANVQTFQYGFLRAIVPSIFVWLGFWAAEKDYRTGICEVAPITLWEIASWISWGIVGIVGIK
jgi:hypothetical protein